MKEIFVKTDKAFIANLPRYLYDGRIVIVQSENEATRAVRALRHSALLGIDTETRPTFRKGVVHKVALLQIAAKECCFLFRLCHMGLPACLTDLLSDPAVIKVGLSLKDDFMMLRQRTEFTPAGYVEIQTMARQAGIEDMSLQKLYANLFQKKISKRAQLSNWEADALTEAQARYAATDAVACIHLYEELRSLSEKNNFKLIENENNPIRHENHTTETR